MIKIIEDVGAPAVVTAIDMLTLEMAPDYNEIASYVMTGVGYVAGGLGLGGRSMQDFLTKVGIASLPLTARAIRERVKSPVSQRAGASRLALRPVASSGIAHPVSRSYQPEFEKVSPYAV